MKIKKLISVFLSVIIGTTLMAANISAADTADERAASTMACVDDIVENEALTNSSDIVYLGNVNWVDSMTVRWREGNTTAYHTITCRISDLYVYDTPYSILTYTNHNGTYGGSGLCLLEVAPNTLFMCSDVYSSPSSGYNSDYTDPIFGLNTPRRLTLSELADDDVVAYVVYDLNTGTVIDFYSTLNPLIMSGWSVPNMTY